MENTQNNLNQNSTQPQQGQGSIPQEAYSAPTFDQLAQSSSQYISPKNYKEGQRLKMRTTAFNGMNFSEKFKTWSAEYKTRMDGQDRKISLNGKHIATLKNEYGITDFNQLVGKDLTLLVVKGTSNLTFVIANVE